jgi:glycosyltransferase involved in cell wall biosynthesis
MTDYPIVTIAIPVLNEAERLPGLLDALRAQTWPRHAMQIIVADGGSDDDSVALARAAGRDFPDFEVIPNPGRIAAAGLNRALDMARGEFFVRLDARSRPAPDYLERCVAHLQEGEWAGVGGAQVAIGASDAGRAIALVLNHPLGAGSPKYRRTNVTGESETIYLGAYWVDWLHRAGGWDEGFVANEDYDLNTRLRKLGGRLLVAQDIRLMYIARDSLRALAKQYFRYGCWRAVTWRRHPRAMRWRHLLPALWLAGLVLGMALAPFSPWPLLALTLPYVLIISLTTALLAVGRGWRLAPRIGLAFPTMHLCWGAGFWYSALMSSLSAFSVGPCARPHMRPDHIDESSRD